MAKLYKTSGKIVEVYPENGKDFSLDELQGFVDGYIEIVWLDKERIMVINEDGKLNNLPINKKATEEYNNSYKGRDGIIVGNALICDNNQVK